MIWFAIIFIQFNFQENHSCTLLKEFIECNFMKKKIQFDFIYKKNYSYLLLLEKEGIFTILKKWFLQIIKKNNFLKNYLKKYFNSIWIATKIIFITFIENKTFIILFTKILKSHSI